MKYPKDENAQFALALNITKGLIAHPDIYPEPPIKPSDMQAKIDLYTAKRDAANVFAMQAVQATEEKNAALEDLNEANKSEIRYAENTTDFNDDELKLISWGGRAASVKLQVPGACRALEVVKQGDGWIFLDWKEPSDGGKPAAYKLQRSADGGTTWTDVGTAIPSEYTLHNQPTGAKLLYQVVATNRTGDGLPSNAVSVSL